MRELIARLINCGFDREVAVAIACNFKRTRNLFELERYVASVEDEVRDMEDNGYELL